MSILLTIQTIPQLKNQKMVLSNLHDQNIQSKTYNSDIAQGFKTSLVYDIAVLYSNIAQIIKIWVKIKNNLHIGTIEMS